MRVIVYSTPFNEYLLMDGKKNVGDVVIIVLVWLIAAALAYQVFIKLRLLFK